VGDPRRISAASRQRVARAFAATSKPLVTAAFAEVACVLDGRARLWADLRSDLCETARDRPGPTDQLAGLRALCLDRRLSELRGFVAALTTASADVVQRAPEAANGLAGLDACADPCASGWTSEATMRSSAPSPICSRTARCSATSAGCAKSTTRAGTPW